VQWPAGPMPTLSTTQALRWWSSFPRCPEIQQSFLPTGALGPAEELELGAAVALIATTTELCNVLSRSRPEGQVRSRWKTAAHQTFSADPKRPVGRSYRANMSAQGPITLLPGTEYQQICILTIAARRCDWAFDRFADRHELGFGTEWRSIVLRKTPFQR
jgi:hypothetical protein